MTTPFGPAVMRRSWSSEEWESPASGADMVVRHSPRRASYRFGQGRSPKSVADYPGPMLGDEGSLEAFRKVAGRLTSLIRVRL